MKYFIYLIAITILLGINLGLFGTFPINGQIPNLLFLLTICFALEKDGQDFLFIALISGLFLDFYSTSFFGSFAFVFLTLSFCLHLIVKNLLAAELNWKILSLTIVICLVILDLLVWLYGLLAFKFNWISFAVNFKFLIASFPAALFYNLLLLYPVYLVSNFLKQFVDNLSLKRRGVIK